MVGALAARPDVDITGYVLSARTSARQLAAVVSRYGVGVDRSSVPATLCHLAWGFSDRPKLRRLTVDADVVHGTNYTAPPVSARLITVQDLGLVTRPEWCRRSVRRMVPALRRAVDRGAHLHVTTRTTAAEVAKILGAEPSRTHVVPVGVPSVGAGDGAAARRLVGANRYVLALGTTEPRKNISTLPTAMTGLPTDIKLVVAGPEGTDEARLCQSVRSCGLGERFVRLTRVNSQLRADLLHGAAALAYPSLLEGFGLPPLEAAAAGIPVVATAVGALPELLGPETPLAPPGDLQRFARLLAEVASEPPQSCHAVQARIAELTWPRAAERLLDVYSRIMAGG